MAPLQNMSIYRLLSVNSMRLIDIHKPAQSYIDKIFSERQLGENMRIMDHWIVLPSHIYYNFPSMQFVAYFSVSPHYNTHNNQWLLSVALSKCGEISIVLFILNGTNMEHDPSSIPFYIKEYTISIYIGEMHLVCFYRRYICHSQNWNLLSVRLSTRSSNNI